MGFGEWMKKGFIEAAENKKNGGSILYNKNEMQQIKKQFKEDMGIKDKQEEEKKVCCPKCGSTQLTANKKGYSLGKAIAGGVITLTPIVGVATGLIGKNKIIITCLNCGKQFKPGK